MFFPQQVAIFGAFTNHSAVRTLCARVERRW